MQPLLHSYAHRSISSSNLKFDRSCYQAGTSVIKFFDKTYILFVVIYYKCLQRRPYIDFVARAV